MQNSTPDDATGDSVLLARVHTFLVALLSFLGFGVLPTATIVDMLDELTGWLEMAKAIRRDPQGATARIWWDAFKIAWQDDESETAGRRADLAAGEFGKRFLPVNAEDDRDTLNTEDFNALREELDKQTQIAAELRSEREALLEVVTHHADEIMAMRVKLANAIVPLPKPERVESGQRWAMIVTAGAVQSCGENLQWEVQDWHVSDGLGAYRFALPVDSQVVKTSMHYLGTEAK
jgi:hypothetical protein